MPLGFHIDTLKPPLDTGQMAPQSQPRARSVSYYGFADIGFVLRP